MQPHTIGDVLISREKLRRGVARMARSIARELPPDANVIAVGVLRGGFVFLADLLRALSDCGVPSRVDFLTLASYGHRATSSGRVRVERDVSLSLRGADVLLVEDVLDSGRTLDFARRHLERKHPRSLRTCVLLDKPESRRVPCRADFIGFRIEDVFVVGYGLDYAGYYRGLPHVARVEFRPKNRK